MLAAKHISPRSIVSVYLLNWNTHDNKITLIYNGLYALLVYQEVLNYCTLSTTYYGYHLKAFDNKLTDIFVCKTQRAESGCL